MTNVKRFNSKKITPHSVVNHLNDKLGKSEIKEIFVIYVNHEEEFEVAIAGTAYALSHAAVIMLRQSMEHL